MQSRAAAPQDTNRIYPGISSFAWNSDCSKIAVCPTNKEIWIFKTNSTADTSKWERIQVLREHLNPVSSLDWHPQTNLLLSSSTDRGVIVWEESKEFVGLKPQLAIVKETKANIDAAWNNNGTKFIVGAASGHVFIGNFSAANNFWIGQALSRKPLHKSSVVSVRFDPMSGKVCASGSTDGTCQITTCFVRGVDNDQTQGPFGGVTSFGENLLIFSSNGWVNNVSFSQNSSLFCYATHDCELNFFDISQAAQKVKAKPDKVLYKGNPFLNGIFVNETTYIACGYDKVPFVFKKNGSNWEFVKYLDDGINKVKDQAISSGSFDNAQAFFKRSETEKASGVKLDEDVGMREMSTKHQNYINCLKVYASRGGAPSVISTSDINGYINYWDLQSA